MAINGGRWNPIGMPAIYAAESIALASLEKWVHLAGVMPATPLTLVAVEVPTDAGPIVEIPLEDLPENWAAMPSSEEAAAVGKAWLTPDEHGSISTLGFTVPSVIVPESVNLVLNPAHPNMAQVTLSVVRGFAFDGPMLKH
jgi:RES domain-containing protein